MEFRDLKAQYKKYKKEIDSSIQGVLNNARFIGGEQVTLLEQRLSEYVGTKHCITCANGTEAMTLLMMAWDIKEGDAVFVPDFTFFSTGEVVSFRGATPIFVDVDRDTFNIDPIKLENTIKKMIAEGKLFPKAIIPVDLFGLPANYTEHLGWREKHLKSIDMNYRKSKYYREIFPLMEECLSIASSNLADYNSQVVKKILDVLDIDTNCIYSHELGITAVGTERLVEIVKCLDGFTYLSGSGGSKYQDEEIFKAHGIQLSYSRFIPPKYTQCWGDFISNLSIVDYLFNNGISDCRKYLEL